MNNYYIITGIIVLICFAAIIFAIRIFRDTRKMQEGEDDAPQGELFENISHRRSK